MNQDEFMKSETKVSYVLPGGRGSGKKVHPLFIKKLAKEFSMRTSVTKIITFETAHQLADSYAEECQNIHGHSYKCEATFEGDIDRQTGMIIDFKRIKEMLDSVHKKYDHAFFTKDNFGSNPTAENMCLDIFWMLRNKTTLIKKVRLWETASCYTEISY